MSPRPSPASGRNSRGRRSVDTPRTPATLMLSVKDAVEELEDYLDEVRRDDATIAGGYDRGQGCLVARALVAHDALIRLESELHRQGGQQATSVD